MSSIDSIRAALEKAEVKKSRLRETYDNLKALSSSLSSFTLQWEDLEEHFNSIQSQIELKFKQLEDHAVELETVPSTTEPSSNAAQPETVAVRSRTNLKTLCTEMDGEGLFKYLNENKKLRQTIKKELPSALMCSPDPASLVLDVIGGFCSSNPKGRNCVMLLEELLGIKHEVSSQAKEKAKSVAMELKGKVNTSGENQLEALCFLQLLASYGLGVEFGAEILIEFFVASSRHSEVLPLSHILLSAQDISHVIEKLIDADKQNLALKYIFEYGLTEKFPPVPLLKEIITQARKAARKVREDGNNSLQSLNEAADKETSALRQVIKFIEDYNLDSEYPKLNLGKRIEQLENEKKNRKRPAAAVASTLQQTQTKSLKQKGNKGFRVAPAAGISAVPVVRPSHLQSAAGMLADRSATYLSPPVYVGPATANYPSTTPGLYSSGGTGAGYVNKLSPSRPHLYHPSGLPSSYRDRPATYGGYGYPTTYYPQ